MQPGIGVLVGLAAGLLVAVLGLRLFIGRRLSAARDEQSRLTEEARRSAGAGRRGGERGEGGNLGAKKQPQKLRAEVENELRDKRAEIVKIEERVLAKEDEIDSKLTEFDRQEEGVSDQEARAQE